MEGQAIKNFKDMIKLELKAQLFCQTAVKAKINLFKSIKNAEIKIEASNNSFHNLQTEIRITMLLISCSKKSA